MKLYARQLGWLHTKRPKAKNSRGKELGENAQLPPLKGAKYLMDMLLECGLADLGWRELEAWQALTGTPINSWEAQAMIATSKAYSSSVAEFTDSNERAPYQPLDFDRDKVADQVRGALRKRR